jgi:hypothetical protein
MVEVTHLDSCILRAIIDRDDNKERKRIVRHLMNTTLDRPFRVSLVAVGEVTGKMAEDSSVSACAEAGAELRKLFMKRRLELFGMGRGGEVLNMAGLIQDLDPLLTPSDIVIVACALVDPQCGRFLTVDDKLLESRSLKRLGRENQVLLVDLESISHTSRGSLTWNPREKAVVIREQDNLIA